MADKNARNSKEAAARAVKEKQRDFEKKIDAIRAELKEKGPEAAERSLGDLKASLEDKFNDMEEGLSDTRESLTDALESGKERIKEQPLLAIGAAFAIGAVVGLIFGRKGCKD